MAEIVQMPKLSDTMTEGVVAEWHKKVGDEVESGELLAEIETDKATMEFESFQDGVLLYIGVQKGDSAPVDSVLCILGEKGEDYKALLAETEPASAEAEEKTMTPAPAAAPKAAPSPAAAPAAPVSAPSTSAGGRLKASPLARRMAEDRGVDIAAIQGSGDNGRIVKRDVESYQGGSVATGSSPAAYRPIAAGQESFTDTPVSPMRKVIAQRLAESKFSAPHFYLTVEIDMSEAMRARKMVNAQIAPDKISFNDMVIKAAATALRKHPAVNSSWLGDTIRRNDHIHIGVAVAVDEGLLVPVVRHADTKPMVQINAEVKDFATRAKSKKLNPDEWAGNTFTISNLGMFGIEEFTAIINPPDACILAIGGIIEKPVVKDGQIVVGHRMKVTLSCDHRVVDGAVGSAFLNTFKAHMEQPLMMVV